MNKENIFIKNFFSKNDNNVYEDLLRILETDKIITDVKLIKAVELYIKTIFYNDDNKITLHYKNNINNKNNINTKLYSHLNHNNHIELNSNFMKNYILNFHYSIPFIISMKNNNAQQQLMKILLDNIIFNCNNDNNDNVIIKNDKKLCKIIPYMQSYLYDNIIELYNDINDNYHIIKYKKKYEFKGYYDDDKIAILTFYLNTYLLYDSYSNNILKSACCLAIMYNILPYSFNLKTEPIFTNKKIKYISAIFYCMYNNNKLDSLHKDEFIKSLKIKNIISIEDIEKLIKKENFAISNTKNTLFEIMDHKKMVDKLILRKELLR